MIEKMEKFVAVSRQQISTPELVDCLNLLTNKINELVDYVNALIESNNIGYRFCEPVRPDDDVIYKGE